MKVIPASAQSGKLMGCQSGCTIADAYIYPTVSFSLRMVNQSSLVTRPGYFLVVAAVLHGVAGLVFNGEITAKTDGL